MAIKHTIKKVAQKMKRDNERGAREAVLEELFYDFHRNRVQVYKVNFVRGIFMGVGTVIGGTLGIALIAWVLSLFVDLPGIGNSIEQVQESIQNSQKK